jgi:hypothetical protein
MKSLFILLVLVGILSYVGYTVWTSMASSGVSQKLDQNAQTLKEVDK